jgi:hypothetical protein
MFARALLLTTCLIMSGAVSVSAFDHAARCRGWKCAYWFFCSLTTATGLAGVLGLLAIPIDGQGNPSGEMPPEFRLAVALISIGVALSLLGFIVNALRLWGSRRAGARLAGDGQRTTSD